MPTTYGYNGRYNMRISSINHGKNPSQLLLTVFIIINIVLIVSVSGLRHTAQSLVIISTTLSLAALMAASVALINSGYPSLLLSKLIIRFRHNPVITLWIITAASGLLAAITMNDAVLFLSIPLSIELAEAIHGDKTQYAAITLLGVNIGSALTPMGNPQNLMIASHYRLGIREFIEGMLPFTFIGYLLLMIYIIPVGMRAHREPEVKEKNNLSQLKLITGLASITIIVIGIDTGNQIQAAIAGLLLIAFTTPTSLVRMNKEILAILVLLMINFYYLGNKINSFLPDGGASGLGIFAWAVLFSQLIGNVPATSLLINKTADWLSLSYAVNAGGVILITGSYANLIAYKLSKAGLKELHRYLIVYGGIFLVAILLYILYI